MTNDEAIEILKKDGWGYPENMHTEAVMMAIDALERQIPKPPIPDYNTTDIYGYPVPRCQACGYALDLRMEQYCPCCGQRLTEYEEAQSD